MCITALITQEHGERTFSLGTHDFTGSKNTQAKLSKSKGRDSSSNWEVCSYDCVLPQFLSGL